MDGDYRKGRLNDAIFWNMKDIFPLWKPQLLATDERTLISNSSTLKVSHRLDEVQPQPEGLRRLRVHQEVLVLLDDRLQPGDILEKVTGHDATCKVKGGRDTTDDSAWLWRDNQVWLWRDNQVWLWLERGLGRRQLEQQQQQDPLVQLEGLKLRQPQEKKL